MNADVKTKWLAALRSGEYQQIDGSLHKDQQGFCCLGVLCDLYLKEHPTSPAWQPDGGGVMAIYVPPDEEFPGGTIEVGELPHHVRSWAGLKSADPTPRGSGKSLAGLNDSGYLFPEIADVIEKGL